MPPLTALQGCVRFVTQVEPGPPLLRKFVAHLLPHRIVNETPHDVHDRFRPRGSLLTIDAELGGYPVVEVVYSEALLPECPVSQQLSNLGGKLGHQLLHDFGVEFIPKNHQRGAGYGYRLRFCRAGSVLNLTDKRGVIQTDHILSSVDPVVGIVL